MLKGKMKMLNTFTLDVYIILMISFCLYYFRKAWTGGGLLGDMRTSVTLKGRVLFVWACFVFIYLSVYLFVYLFLSPRYSTQYLVHNVCTVCSAGSISGDRETCCLKARL